MYHKSIDCGDTSLIGKAHILQTNDTHTISIFCSFIHGFWSIPLQIGISFFCVFHLSGILGVTGIGVVFAILLLQYSLAGKTEFFQRQQLRLKDARTKFLSDSIGSILIGGLTAFPKDVGEKIATIRNCEVQALRKSMIMEVILEFVSTNYLFDC